MGLRARPSFLHHMIHVDCRVDCAEVDDGMSKQYLLILQLGKEKWRKKYFWYLCLISECFWWCIS